MPRKEGVRWKTVGHTVVLPHSATRNRLAAPAPDEDSQTADIWKQATPATTAKANPSGEEVARLPSKQKAKGRTSDATSELAGSPAAAPAAAPATSPTLFSRRSLFRGRTFGTAVDDNELQTTVIQLEGCEPSELTIKLDPMGAHTLSWPVPITKCVPSLSSGDKTENKLKQLGKSFKFAIMLSEQQAERGDTVLPAGSCCLYGYPSIKTELEPNGYRPPANVIELLRRVVLAFAAQHPEQFGESVDPVGAHPIHALLVGNNEDSLALAMKIYEMAPKELTRVHGSKLFLGESALHIAAVNRHEALIVKMVQLGCKHLPREELSTWLRSQAEGNFFRDPPQRWYGGTALGYACSFGLKAAVVALLSAGSSKTESPILSLNERADACRLTGALPLHCVVANKNMEMYEFLTNKLGYGVRAKQGALTKLGQLSASLMINNLSPLQLAARLGDQITTRYIIKRQSEIEWVWGPVTQYALSLEGIDSSGTGGGDIMELIVTVGAHQRTTEMVLDSFMNGFIHQLYLSKWRKFGRKLHMVRIILEGVLLAGLVLQVLMLKERSSTESIDDAAASLMPINVAILVIIAVIFALEARFAYLFAINNRGANDARLDFWQMVKKVRGFCRQHAVEVVLLRCLCTIIGTCIMFSSVLSAPEAVEGRQLRRQGGDGANDGAADVGFVQHVDEGTWPLLWIAQTFGLLLTFFQVATLVSTPYEKSSILLFTIIEMLKKDLATFMGLMIWLTLAAYMGLYTLYPRSGDASLPFAEPMNGLGTSFLSIADMNLYGAPLVIDPYAASLDGLSGSQLVALLLWLVLYYAFLVLSAILMLNLLIAMMAETFVTVTSDATLQSRLTFATSVIKLELLARSLGMGTRVGERSRTGEKWVYKFKAFKKMKRETPEGEDDFSDDEDDLIRTEVSADPFQPPDRDSATKCLDLLEQMDAELKEDRLRAARRAGKEPA